MRQWRLSDYMLSVVACLMTFVMIEFLIPDNTEENDMVEPRIEMLYGTIPKTTKRPYFAYGTLTSADVMLMWAGDAEFVGLAKLYGFSRDSLLRIEEDRAGVVTGVLWLLSPTDEISLDVYEGVAGGLYEKIEVDGVLIYY